MTGRSNAPLVVAVGLMLLFSGLAGASTLLERPTHDSSSSVEVQATTTGTATSPTTTQPPTAMETGTSSPTPAPTTTNAGTAADTATGSATLPNLLVIVGSGDGTSYELVVDGELQKSNEQGATIDPEDIVDGSRATGAVAGNGADAYRFSGSITDITLDSDATLYLNGQRYEPHPNQLVIVGSEGSANYTFAVDGKLRKSGDRGASIDEEDTVTGNRATGTVAGNGADAYRFSGSVTNFTLDGDATVYLNGEKVEFGNTPTTPDSGYPPNVFTSISQDCKRFAIESGAPFDTLRVGVAGNTTGTAPYETQTTDAYSFEFEGETRYAASYQAGQGERIVFAYAIRDGRIVYQYEIGACRSGS